MHQRVSSRPDSHLKSARRKVLPLGFILALSVAIVAFKLPIHYQLKTLGDSDPYETEVDFIVEKVVLEKETKLLKEKPRIKPKKIITQFKTSELIFEDDFKDITLLEADFEEDLKVKQADEQFNEPDFLDFAEIMPSFPGGEHQMISYFVRNFRYPAVDIELGNEGTAYVSFIIGKDGKVRNIEFTSGVSRSIDCEITRVLNSMPDWVPGSQRGKLVNVRYRWPIKVKLG